MQLTLIAALLLVCTSCSTRFTISQHLDTSITQSEKVIVTLMKDELPNAQEDKNRPNLEQVQKFREFVIKALKNRNVFSTIDSLGDGDFEVRSSLVEFEKGDAMSRFLFGGIFGKSGVMIVHMQLVNRQSGTVVFAGNFRAKATSWMETSGSSFQYVAIDFANALNKDLKGLKSKK